LLQVSHEQNKLQLATEDQYKILFLRAICRNSRPGSVRPERYSVAGFCCCVFGLQV